MVKHDFGRRTAVWSPCSVFMAEHFAIMVEKLFMLLHRILNQLCCLHLVFSQTRAILCCNNCMLHVRKCLEVIEKQDTVRTWFYRYFKNQCSLCEVKCMHTFYQDKNTEEKLEVITDLETLIFLFLLLFTNLISLFFFFFMVAFLEIPKARGHTCFQDLPFTKDYKLFFFLPPHLFCFSCDFLTWSFLDHWCDCKGGRANDPQAKLKRILLYA